MKTIGIVAEGPRDFELIAAVIDTITNEEKQLSNDSARTQHDRTVWKWLERCLEMV